MLRNSIVLMVTFGFLGCSSYFKRKDCEKTNWYQHGYDVAMEGERLTADHYIKQCEMVDSEINYADLDVGFKKGMGNYCLPKTAYTTGKKGKVFNEDMCDSSGMAELRKRYQAGIKVYCTPNSGYRAGVKGEAYKNVCPAGVEPSFLRKYRQGRTVYLNGAIADKNRKIRSIDRDINDKKYERRRLESRLSSVGSSRISKEKKKYNPFTGKYEIERVEGVDEAVENRRRRLQSSISNLDSDIRNLQNRQSRLRGEIDDMQAELRGLLAENM